MQVARLSRMLGENRVIGSVETDAERVVKSAGRVLRILELFDVLRREALVSEVSDLLNMPQSSTSVLLRSLVVMGYLYYDPESRAFGPTTRVALLGSWINGSLVSDGPLVRLLERINARTGHAVILAVRNQVWVQNIHVVQAPGPDRMFVVKGGKQLLVRTAPGMALLAELPDAEIRDIIARSDAEDQSSERAPPVAAILEAIAAVRANGFAVTPEPSDLTGRAVAVRLPRLINEERFAVAVVAAPEIIAATRDEVILTIHEEITGHFATGQVNVDLASA